MLKIITRLLTIAIVSLAMAMATAWAAPTTVTGILTDSMCTKKHMMPGKTDAECVRACVESGDKYVLVSAGKIYELKGNAKNLNTLAGQKVVVSGNRSGTMIKVNKISATND